MAKVVEFGSAEAEELARRILEEHELEQATKVIGTFDVAAEIKRKIDSAIPVFYNEPPNPELSRWIEFSPFKIEITGSISEEQDYVFPVTMYAKDYFDALYLLDYMIALGKEEIETQGIKIWLYAVQHEVKRCGRNLFKIEFSYYFRLKKLEVK